MESLKLINVKKIVTIIIILLCAFDLKPIDSKVLSKRIFYKTSRLVAKKAFTYGTYQSNLKLYIRFLNEIDFAKLLHNNSINDTLFIVMDFGEFYEVANFNLAIWNNKNEFYFSKQDTAKNESYKRKFNFDRLILFQADKKYGLFSNSTIFYVDKWDKDGLLEEYHKNMLLGGETYVAVRIIRTKQKYKIDCFNVPELYIHKTDYNPMYSGQDIYIKLVESIDSLPFPVMRGVR